MKEILKNPLLWYILIVLSLMGWGTTRIVKKVTGQAKEKADKKTERKVNKKITSNKDDYYSTGYSINTNDKGKEIITAGVVCVLPNNNVFHVTMTTENIAGKMKEIEETIGFLIKHQDEIFDDLIRTVVETGQKQPKQKNERERKIEPAPPTNIKKKV